MKPIFKPQAEVYFAQLYMNGGLGFSIFAYSEYEQKPNYVDYPIMYKDQRFAWNNLYIIPGGIKSSIINTLEKLRLAEVL